MANPNVIIDFEKTLSDNLYDILYKWITEDEREDNREGIQSFGYHPPDTSGFQCESEGVPEGCNENYGTPIEEEWPNSIVEKPLKRSINERQHQVLLELTNNLAQAVEAWTQKQTFNITEMVCPINIEQAQHVNPTMGSGGGVSGPVIIPAIQFQPVMTQGTAEIGQASVLASQGTNAFDAIDTSGVKLQYPEMTSDTSARETVNSE